jgi:hypothetical protein
VPRHRAIGVVQFPLDFLGKPFDNNGTSYPADPPKGLSRVIYFGLRMPAEPAVKRTIAFVDGQNPSHNVRSVFGFTHFAQLVNRDGVNPAP